MHFRQYFLLHLLIQHFAKNVGCCFSVEKEPGSLSYKLQMWHYDIFIIIYSESYLQKLLQYFNSYAYFIKTIAQKSVPYIIQYKYIIVMKQILNLLVIILLALAVVHSKFQPTNTVTLPNGVLDVEYSPDQTWALFATSTFVQIHDGVTLKYADVINFDTQCTFSSMSFSQDSTKFAVGFKTANGSTNFGYYTKTKQQNQQISISSAIWKSDGVSGQVNSICFTADNKYVVFGTSEGDIVVWQNNTSAFTLKFGQSLPITSVACSPYRSLQFTVAGGLKQTAKKLSTYAFNPITQVIEEIKSYASIKDDETIASITYSPTGIEIYRVGTTNQINIHSVDDNQARFVALPQQFSNLHKIRLSKKADVIGVCTQNKLLILKYKPNANDFEQQVYPIVVPTFGLGPQGANALYLSQDNIAQVLGQCPAGKFLNDATDTCDSCNNACNLCLDHPNTCYSCKDGHYLLQYSCLNCLSNCKTCASSSVCQKCFDPFILSNATFCGCEKGKFVDTNTCTTCAEGCQQCQNLQNCKKCTEDYELENGICQSPNSFPTWAVILLIILGVSIVIIIVGIIFIKLRKNQKRSPLLTDSDEGERQANTAE